MLNHKRFAINLRGIAAALLESRAERPIHLRYLLLSSILLTFTSCATRDSAHRIVISGARTEARSARERQADCDYRFLLPNTSGRSAWKFPARRWVTLRLPIKSAMARARMVFKSRRRTGGNCERKRSGPDPIVTRIIWLRGRELNANAFARDIYIHGTPEERNIGLPVSYGCIRMPLKRYHQSL